MRSMTGYAKATFSTEKGSYQFEVKSYNSKFLDISIKLPKNYTEWERRLQRLVTDRIERGRIEIFLLVDTPAEKAFDLVLNNAMLNSYYRFLRKIKSQYKIADAIQLSTLVNLKEVFSLVPKAPDLTKEWKLSEGHFVKAIAELMKMKETEGKFLKTKFSQQISELGKLVKAIAQAHHSGLQEMQKRYKERIRELCSGSRELDEWKLEQESLYYITRSDIHEECSRIESHLAQFDSLIEDSGTMGRKMEFLVQELGREVNTIGAKSQSAEVSRYVIDAKSILDKVREQTMNIE